MTWADKWRPRGLSDKWIDFITSNSSPGPGVNYPLIKTHKPGNPARVITSGCGTPTENLSLFVEKYCKIVVDTIPCRVQDTRHMLNIIDELNLKGVENEDLLVSFDITNMFPSIDNHSGVEKVRHKLNQYAHKIDVPVECVVEALGICLKRNCSTFCGQYWLQENGTAMGPKNSCSYADIVAENIDQQVLASRFIYPELLCWFRFRDDTIVLWRGSVARLNMFFGALNTFDPHLQFTMDMGGQKLHFLDLLIAIVDNKLVTSVYSKPTDTHVYLNAMSSHPKSQIRGIAKGVALRLRRICSEDSDFHAKSKIYAQYLIDCGHNSAYVNRVFEEVGAMTRAEARIFKPKAKRSQCVFVTKYNPRVRDIASIFREHRAIIDMDERASKILPKDSILVAYSRHANLKELLAPSNPYRGVEPAGRGCVLCAAKRCDCCKHFLMPGKSFSSAATGRLFDIRKTLMCTSVNVVYLAHCVACGVQGVGSTHKFKPRLANYKSHIKLKRRTCGVVNHFIDVHGGSYSNLKFMLIDSSMEDLRKCENFWIGTLLTNLRGLNTSHDYSQQ